MRRALDPAVDGLLAPCSGGPSTYRSSGISARNSSPVAGPGPTVCVQLGERAHGISGFRRIRTHRYPFHGFSLGVIHREGAARE